MQDLEQGDPVTRILLIEDNEGDVFLLRMALKNASFRHSILAISDGAEALEYFRTNRTSGQPAPDLILLDLNLPRVDGVTLIELLRNDPHLRNTPVVVMSSSQSPKDAGCIAGLNRAMFVLKPSELTAFMEVGVKVREFLRGSRQFSAGAA